LSCSTEGDLRTAERFCVLITGSSDGPGRLAAQRLGRSGIRGVDACNLQRVTRTYPENRDTL